MMKNVCLALTALLWLAGCAAEPHNYTHAKPDLGYSYNKSNHYRYNRMLHTQTDEPVSTSK